MFRQFHSPFAAPAWAGAGGSHPFFRGERHRHNHKGATGGGWGDQPRHRRGDIKFMLLGLLAEQAQHGYELIKELEARGGGFRRLSPGSVYPTLQMLEEAGYLTSEPVDGKRVYTITESGRQFLSDFAEKSAQADRHPQADSSSPRDRFTQGKPSELMELRQTLTDLNDAVTQIARSGNLEQANQVRALLAQVKREIYTLLAEQ
jgi:DNA-binding PadR family transcriptional regulator